MLTETGAEGYKIGLNNSPLTSNSALAAVEAAAIANGGSLTNVAPGVSFFATLNKNGAFVNTIADATTAQSGTTNVILWWDYLQANGGIGVPGWTVTIPTDVELASTTRRASTLTRRTLRLLVSGRSTCTRSTGQNLWLAGGARPAELAFMQAHNTANRALRRQAARSARGPDTAVPLDRTDHRGGDRW